jgi:FAD/FMN-containing dehydrogenase
MTMNTLENKLLKDKLKRIIPYEQLFTESAYLDVYSNDASIYSVRPFAVVKILSAANISSVLAICNELGVPITARGGATGLAGGAVGSGVILDFCDYDKKIALDTQKMTAKASVGVIYEDLNLQAAKLGLMFPPDPSSGDSCRIGGMLGNNSSGSRTVRYGATRQYTESVNIFTADGRYVHVKPLEIDSNELEEFFLENPEFEKVMEVILKNRDIILPRRRNVKKNSSGYDLWSFLDRFDEGWIDFTKMLIGSEGTLCVFEGA